LASVRATSLLLSLASRASSLVDIVKIELA
jgi:hypothetical protein